MTLSKRTRSYSSLHKKSRWEADLALDAWSVDRRELDRLSASLASLRAERERLDRAAQERLGQGYIDLEALEMLDRYRQSLDSDIGEIERQAHEQKEICDRSHAELINCSKRAKYLMRRVQELTASDQRESERKVERETEEIFLLQAK